jgi:hypothetical protein
MLQGGLDITTRHTLCLLQINGRSAAVFTVRKVVRVCESKYTLYKVLQKELYNHNFPRFTSESYGCKALFEAPYIMYQKSMSDVT